jgi:RimJ/RimL family protein N-acetyltransferase
MSVEIRRLTEQDWQAYRDIRLEALQMAPEAFGADYEEARRRPEADWVNRVPVGDSFVLGAFVDGRIVGMAGFNRERAAKTRHKGSVWGVYVSPTVRGTGAGRRLMAELLVQARQQEGLEQIHLSVVADNVPARQLYLSLGFVVYGLEPRALKVAGRYLDEEHMVLLL